MSKKRGLVISGETIQQILKQLWDEVNRHGYEQSTQTQTIKYLPSVTLVLTEPDSPIDRYPYWDQESDEWYLDTFIRDSLGPPEKTGHDIILPYTYSWRSRFHDAGWGHMWGVVRLLQKLNYSELPFERVADIQQLIRESYRYYHPNIVLGVMAWQKRSQLELFLANPLILAQIVKSVRRDILSEIIDHLNYKPSSHKAITPSLLYHNLDTHRITTHTPAYQNYQVQILKDVHGQNTGFQTFHHHRAMDAGGSGQLDFSHDLEWGKEVAEQLGLPLRQITIHTNLAYLITRDRTNTGNPENIADQLTRATGGYFGSKHDIEQTINHPRFIEKAEYVLQNLHKR